MLVGDVTADFGLFVTSVRNDPLQYRPHFSPPLSTTLTQQREAIYKDMRYYIHLVQEIVQVLQLVNEYIIRFQRLSQDGNIFVDTSTEISSLITYIRKNLHQGQQILEQLTANIQQQASGQPATSTKSSFQDETSSSGFFGLLAGNKNPISKNALQVKKVIFDVLQASLAELTRVFTTALHQHSKQSASAPRSLTSHPFSPSLGQKPTSLGSGGVNPTTQRATQPFQQQFNHPQPPPPLSQQHNLPQSSGQVVAVPGNSSFFQPSSRAGDLSFLFDSSTSTNEGTAHSKPSSSAHTPDNRTAVRTLRPTTLPNSTAFSSNNSIGSTQFPSRNFQDQNATALMIEEEEQTHRRQHHYHNTQSFASLASDVTPSGLLSKAANQSDAYFTSRQSALQNIKDTLSDVAMMYTRLTELTHQQEETVLQIDANVQETAFNIEAANDELLDLYTHVSSNQWLLLKIFAILIIFAIIFVTVLAK